MSLPPSPPSPCQVLVEILGDLQLGQYEVKLNHRRLLDAMLDIAGVPPQKFRWGRALRAAPLAQTLTWPLCSAGPALLCVRVWAGGSGEGGGAHCGGRACCDPTAQKFRRVAEGREEE